MVDWLLEPASLKNIQDLRQLIEPETVLKLHTGTEKESA